MSEHPSYEPGCSEAAKDAVDLTIESRSRELADGFMVRRLLPIRQRRRVGPFVYFDHMGPTTLPPHKGLDVRPHPHIGLSTVTYLFDGELLHRDSLGSEQIIRAGEVNWMTAGRGIAHSERSPEAARKAGPPLHGLQLWAALPSASEDAPPSFQHHAAGDIPEVTLAGARLRIVAGSSYGAAAPVKVSSSLFYVEARLEGGAEIHLPAEYAERAAYIVQGAVLAGRSVFRSGMMAVFRERGDARIKATEASRVMLLGGAPLDGERYIWWNFVSSSKQKIEEAKRAWKAGEFQRIPGDDLEFVPLPDGLGS